MRGRRGYTIVELLIVVCILGILATIAIPKLQGARAHARAADIVGVLRAVRIASTIYFDSANTYPPTAAAGNVPTGLAGYLPRGGNGIFTGNGWTLRWRKTSIVSGGSTTTEGSMVVRTTDPLLCEPLSALLGGPSASVTVSCSGGAGRITQTVER